MESQTAAVVLVCIVFGIIVAAYLIKRNKVAKGNPKYNIV